MSSALTKDIKVSVEHFFHPDLNNTPGDEFIFVYNISIENLGDDTVKLLSRCWKILDAMGNLRIVEGEGVIGQQPIIAPGNVHKYSSSCNLSTNFGIMSGFYNFVSLSDRSTFRAEIPAFQMEVPFLLS